MLSEKLPLYEHYYRRIPRLKKKKNSRITLEEYMTAEEERKMAQASIKKKLLIESGNRQRYEARNAPLHRQLDIFKYEIPQSAQHDRFFNAYNQRLAARRRST